MARGNVQEYCYACMIESMLNANPQNSNNPLNLNILQQHLYLDLNYSLNNRLHLTPPDLHSHHHRRVVNQAPTNANTNGTLPHQPVTYRQVCAVITNMPTTSTITIPATSNNISKPDSSQTTDSDLDN
jgi:hypothetical protein